MQIYGPESMDQSREKNVSSKPEPLGETGKRKERDEYDEDDEKERKETPTWSLNDIKKAQDMLKDILQKRRGT